MSVKIRLQRFGKKHQSFYHIVVADARAPRDGKFIEKIGIYNPRTNPATIELNNEKALKWLSNGAQASDTCRAILSYRGVLYKKHLDEGVRKKAISQEDADARYNAWLEQKNLSISKKADAVMNERKEAMTKRLAEESKAREKIAEKVSAKRLAEMEALEASARKAAAEATGEATAEEAEAPEAATEPAAEEAPKAATEAKAEAAPEQSEPKADVKAEAAPEKAGPKAEAPPAAEEKTETPKAEEPKAKDQPGKKDAAGDDAKAGEEPAK